MADTKISALTAVTSPAGTDEFAVNQGGASKKITLAQIGTALGTDASYITAAASSALSAEIVIPGLAGSADCLPTSPSAYDDEFEGSSLDGDWTTIGSPTITVANSLVRLYSASTGTFQLHGILRSAPSTPFTVTMKLVDQLTGASYRSTHLMVGEASPGKYMGHQYGSTSTYGPGDSNVGYGIWSSRTARSSWGGDVAWGVGLPCYLRLVVASSTSVTTQFSLGGKVFRTINTAVNPGFTVGSVAIMISGQDNSVQAEAYVDWVRFT
jgi:hypothetical protein